MLPNMKSLKKLSLKGISYKIIMLLVEARESIKRGIEILDVNEEIFNFSKSLSENPSGVTEIDLKGKSMIEGDGLCIARTVHYFPSLNRIDLRMTHLSTRELDSIENEIEQRELTINVLRFPYPIDTHNIGSNRDNVYHRR